MLKSLSQLQFNFTSSKRNEQTQSLFKFDQTLKFMSLSEVLNNELSTWKSSARLLNDRYDSNSLINAINEHNVAITSEIPSFLAIDSVGLEQILNPSTHMPRVHQVPEINLATPIINQSAALAPLVTSSKLKSKSVRLEIKVSCKMNLSLSMFLSNYIWFSHGNLNGGAKTLISPVHRRTPHTSQCVSLRSNKSTLMEISFSVSLRNKKPKSPYLLIYFHHIINFLSRQNPIMTTSMTLKSNKWLSLDVFINCRFPS
jgi:hypothetical protein